MTTERNRVTLYTDWYRMLGDINKYENPKIGNALERYLQDYPNDLAYIKQQEFWYFVLRRESILIKRGKGSATDKSPISSVGYVGLSSAVRTALKTMRNAHGGQDLHELWQFNGRWGKDGMFVMNFLYKDSKLSGIIAHRAIDQNHFLDAKLNDDAKARYEKKDPANPNLITGSWEDYTKISYEKTLGDVAAQMRTASREFRDAANARGEFYKGTPNFQQKF